MEHLSVTMNQEMDRIEMNLKRAILGLSLRFKVIKN